MSWVEGVVTREHPRAPVLEIGSLNINGTVRDLFPQEGYVGLDKRAGPGVDLVADICEGRFFREFRTVVCCETLEHITRPWEAIEEMHSALRPGGLFIGTWCFVYVIHNEPEDYWRVTPAGFRLLLEDAGFSDIKIETEGEGPVGVFAVGRA
jgi:SAM-dependent methyltransferase